jgi:hypothetical protein
VPGRTRPPSGEEPWGGESNERRERVPRRAPGGRDKRNAGVTPAGATAPGGLADRADDRLYRAWRHRTGVDPLSLGPYGPSVRYRSMQRCFGSTDRLLVASRGPYIKEEGPRRLPEKGAEYLH